MILEEAGPEFGNTGAQTEFRTRPYAISKPSMDFEGEILELLENWRDASFTDLILIQQTRFGEAGKGAPHDDANT